MMPWAQFIDYCRLGMSVFECSWKSARAKVDNYVIYVYGVYIYTYFMHHTVMRFE